MRASDRAAWTLHVTGEKQKVNKYGAKRKGRYASHKEEEVARSLWALQKSGEITDLREQVKFTIAAPRNGVNGVYYIADFTFISGDGNLHVCDAKGFKTQVYRLKKRLLYLQCGIEIEEIS